MHLLKTYLPEESEEEGDDDDDGRPRDGEEETVVLLGEGCFSYALALKLARPGWAITATTLEDEEATFTDHGLESLEAFAEAGGAFEFGVDATRPLPRRLGEAATLVEFNYPHTGSPSAKANH